MEDCAVEANESRKHYGGGLYLQRASATFLRTSFRDNVSAACGGAIAASESTISCTNCNFAGNAPDDLCDLDTLTSSNFGNNATFVYDE